MKRYTNMEFDRDGKVLLLWGPNDVGVVLVPDSVLSDGFMPRSRSIKSETEICKYLTVYSIEEDETEKSAEILDQNLANKIVKACFHPSNSSAIVVLRETKWLKVVNITQYESQTILLGPGKTFKSCCFGSSMFDFTSFCLFLLSSTGEVYYLCPIIPKGKVRSALGRDRWMR